MRDLGGGWVEPRFAYEPPRPKTRDERLGLPHQRLCRTPRGIRPTCPTRCLKCRGEGWYIEPVVWAEPVSICQCCGGTGQAPATGFEACEAEARRVQPRCRFAVHHEDVRRKRVAWLRANRPAAWGDPADGPWGRRP